MPGYTHLQVAMPSSFGLWFGAYAESLVDDLTVLQAAYRVSNRNPLGSAAGYGSSFPLDRSLTTRLLGFDSMNYNVVYAQMGRGKPSASSHRLWHRSPPPCRSWLSMLACSTPKTSDSSNCPMLTPPDRASCRIRKSRRIRTYTGQMQ